MEVSCINAVFDVFKGLTIWYRPIAAYAALDLPTYYIDLTPFIPLLVDGHAHNITLDVLSAEDDHGINQNWFVTANLQVLLDTSDKATSGRMTVHSAEPFAKTTTTGSVSEEGDIDFTVKATRDIRIESDIVSGSGKHTHVVWSQSLAYQNTQTFRQNGTIQVYILIVGVRPGHLIVCRPYSSRRRERFRLHTMGSRP